MRETSRETLRETLQRLCERPLMSFGSGWKTAGVVRKRLEDRGWKTVRKRLEDRWLLLLLLVLLLAN